MCGSIDEESVDCDSVCVKILTISCRECELVSAYPKGSPSRLPGRAGPWWIIIIGDQEHSLVSIHAGPTIRQLSSLREHGLTHLGK